MKMREVVKWNKDHVTGEKVEMKCYKPNNGVKGTAKIEIYGADGELKNETFTENIILNHVNGAEAYRQLFRSIAYGGSTAMYGRNEQVGAFRNIVLGTSAVEEDVNRVKSEAGDIVGWCPIKNTNAGSDVTRGVYNPTESYDVWDKGYFHRHLVYDFGTSQGNGTFNSVWWSKDVYDSNDTGGGKIVNHTIEWVNPVGSARPFIYADNLRVWTGVNGTVWALDTTDNKYKRLVNGVGYLHGIHPKEFSTKPEDIVTNFIEVPTCLCEIPATDGEYVQISDYVQKNGTYNSFANTFTINRKDKTGKVLNSYPVDIWQFPNTAVISSWNTYRPATSSARIYATQIHYVADNGDVWIRFYGNNGTTSSSSGWFRTYNDGNDTLGGRDTYKYDCYCKGVFNIFSGTWVVEPNFEEINSMRDITGFGSVLGKVTVNNQDYYYRRNSTHPIVTLAPHSDREYYMVATSIGHIHNLQSQPFYSDSDVYSYPMAHIPGENYIACYNNHTTYHWDWSSTRKGYGGDFRICPGYSAHTKLPNPVTKTSADTMKVQYDIYIQVPKVVSKDGDFLTFEDETATTV